MPTRSPHLATQAVHAGEGRVKAHNSLTTPVVQTTTYTFGDSEEINAYMQRKAAEEALGRDEYGRYGNPTVRAAEEKLAALEGAEAGLLFASGMNAITTTLLARLSVGDHLLLVSGSYHRTTEFAWAFLGRWGIETTLVPIDDPEAWEAACRPNTRLIFAETPTNPYLRVIDLEALADFARRHKLTSVVDSTFATPLNLRPLEYGIDLVIHSASKYLSGHNDLLAGAVLGSQLDLASLEHARGVMGGVFGPHDAYLLIRGLKTLAVRVQQQNASAARIAAFLERHPAVAAVHYPGLCSHPDHEHARRQFSGFGGVVSFELQAGFTATGHFLDRLQIPFIGPTLGGVESIVQQPAALFSMDPDTRRAAGLGDSLVRYAVGIEHPDELIADLDQALADVPLNASLPARRGVEARV